MHVFNKYEKLFRDSSKRTQIPMCSCLQAIYDKSKTTSGAEIEIRLAVKD